MQSSVICLCYTYVVANIVAEVMAEIVTSDEFANWYGNLDDPGRKAVAHVVELLARQGLSLGAPYSSALQGTQYGLRELRSKRYGRALRVIYAYDEERDAVLIIGGDKSGRKRFYEEMIPQAEAIWREYLKERRALPPGRARRSAK